MNASSVPRTVLDAQTTASDPKVSAWVSANAGSGKTHVLAQRVIRLLLDGVDPAKVLCLTFTKAAAANMANRVFDTLRKWTALDDTALDAEIAKVEGRPPSASRRLRARRLFAEALETPGGLKVQTIHAFCTALLHQFPFEADVAAKFDVLEERAEAELIGRLQLQVLLEASAQPDTALGRALAGAIVAAADTTFAELVREAVGKRQAVEGWIGRAGGVDAALAELSAALSLGPQDTQEGIEGELLNSSILPMSEWPLVSAALAGGASTDREHVGRLAQARAGNGWINIQGYLRIFCTAEFAPRKNVVTNTIRKNHPDLYARLLSEQERVCALLARRKAILARDRTSALITIADAVLRRYRAEKEQRGLLDYDDLIEKTLKLLSAEGSSAWVMYKLDLGIDHVLVDEAQDTSPRQWEVIQRLTGEFFAGAGARGVKRSIFVVGDEKQSIFSFQGAAPDRFGEMRRYFQKAHQDGGLEFETVPFTYSFRSSPDVLGAVDEVFARPAAHQGLISDTVPTVHEAVRSRAPGFVELWAPIGPEQKQPIEPWDAPFDTASEQSPQVVLARRIAATVRLWIARGDLVGDDEQRRPVAYGDILVLVRQRGPLFEAIIRALKDAGVEVAGADRLILMEHIAIMDLMSLADALLLPHDDLALAEALKSPLVGFDDEQLFALAYGRKGSLRRALREKASEIPAAAQASAMLDRLREAARRQTPFAFYAELLGAGGGRKKMLARLGLEAADALDEFLALALDYERRHSPSLQGFMAWLRAAAAEVKRDMDIARNEVRVMTVHGAKGLEAPIVVLADTLTQPAGPRDPRLITLSNVGIPADVAPIIWAAARDTDAGPMEEARSVARRAAEDEHRRLLYVAMTRAADRLLVCGAHGIRGQPPGCWHELVEQALKPQAVVEEADDGSGDVWRWRKGEAVPVAFDAASKGRDQAQAGLKLPPWLLYDAPTRPQPVVALTPSSTVELAQRRSRRSAAERERDARARRRGVLIHTLLQRLPDMSDEVRASAAHRYLAKAGGGMEAADLEGVVEQVLGLIRHPSFAPLFAPDARAEVPIVGRLTAFDGETIPVFGQIDRLAVTEDQVLIADFKTDRDPPRRVEDISGVQRRQLALYVRLLSLLYSNRAVRAALIFTQSGKLLELPGKMLEAAFDELGIRHP